MILRVASLFLVLSIVLATVAPAQVEPFVERFDQYLVRVADLQLAPGFAVVVWAEGRTLYLKGHGYADIASGRRVTPETVFYIASATKPFFGTAAAILHQRQAWNLDQHLDTQIPGLRLGAELDASSISIRDLLTHTHGIDNEGPVSFRSAYSGTVATDRMIELLSLHGSARQGRNFKYGNIGYNVASLALAKSTAENWKEVVDREIFQPLGMDSSSGYVSTIEPNRLALPYGAEAVGFRLLHYAKADQNMHAAGGLVTSVSDLARWLEVNLTRGLLEGKQVLNAEALHTAHLPHVEQNNKRGRFNSTGYALGWNTGNYEDHPLRHHSGGFPGFHAHLSFLPEAGVGIGVLANSSLGIVLAELVANYTFDVLLHREDAEDRANRAISEARSMAAQIRDRIATDRARRAARPQSLPQSIEAYVGAYENPAYGRVELEQVGGKLEARMGSLWSEVEVYDASKEALRLELTGSGAVIQFSFDEHGRASAFSYGPLRFERVEN